MQALVRNITKSDGQFPWVFLIALGGWVVSGLVFLILSPLQGSLASVSLVMVLLLLVPGFIVIAVVRFTVSSSPWGVLVASFGVGVGIECAVAVVVRLLGLPLSTIGRGLWMLELPSLAILFTQWKRNALVSFQFSARSKRAKQADWILIAALVPMIGAYLLEIQNAIPLGGPTDWPKYLNYASWIIVHPGLPFQIVPPIHTDWQANFRLWWVTLAAITDLVKIDTTVLDVHWRYEPPMLIALSVMAIYAIACEIFERPGARVASVVAQVIYLFAGLPAAFSGHFEWVGYSVLYRLSEDKILVTFVLVPTFSLLALRYLRVRETPALLPIAFASFGTVLIHPLGFPFIALVAGTYGLLSWLAHPSRDVRVYVTLIIMILPLAIFPLAQRLSRSTTAIELDQLVGENVTAVTHYASNSDRILILSSEQNNYIASPHLIQYPVVVLGIVIGLGLALRIRQWRSARFIFGMTVTPLLITYTPGVAPLVGGVIGYDTFWRFIWLLPTCFAVGWGLDYLAYWVAIRLGPHRRIPVLLGTVCIVLTAFWMLGLARDIPNSVSVLQFYNDGGERYRGDRAITMYLADLVHDGNTILAPAFPSQINRTIFANVPDVSVVSWRRSDNVELYNQVTRFFSHTQIDPGDVDLLKNNHVDYIVIPQNALLIPFMSATKFEQVGSVENVNVYRANVNLDYVYFDPLYVQNDYRALAKQIIDESGPKAEVVLDRPGVDETGNWKALQKNVQRFFLENYPDGPNITSLENNTTWETLTPLLEKQNPLYVIFWGEGMQDSERAVERMLNERVYVTGIKSFGRLRLVQYEQLGEPVVSMDSGARFGQSIMLKSFALTTTNLSPDGLLGVRLVWRSDSRIQTPYKVFVHLIAPDGTIASQNDSEPGVNLAPTTSWQPGETIVDNHTLILPHDITPGIYELRVGLYTDEGGRLPVTQAGRDTGDQTILIEISVK